MNVVLLVGCFFCLFPPFLPTVDRHIRSIGRREQDASWKKVGGSKNTKLGDFLTVLSLFVLTLNLSTHTTMHAQ